MNRDKQWGPQTPWWLVLLAVMALGVVFAPNTYAAFWATRDMAVLFLCICLPLQSLVTTVRKVRLFLYTYIAVAVYVGGWAALHGGFGPSGSAGGQDENYVAALMGLATGLAYFSFIAEKRLIPRILLGLAIPVFVAAIANGQNPSRGGFIGLCAVGIYCVARSPRKLLGFGLLALMGVSLLAIAGASFWAEIDTTADYQTGTGDMRLEIWKCGLRMWQANPFFGVGAGNFRWVIGDYESAEQFAKFGRSLGGSIIAHSLPVEMLAELGSAGAIATAILLWRTWSDLGRVRDAIPSHANAALSADLVQLRCYGDAVRVGILAILVNGVFLSLFYYSHLWLLLALGSALPFVYRRTQRQASAGGQGRVAPAGRSHSSSTRTTEPQAAHALTPHLNAGAS
jgi:O-antigen ligase